MSMLSGTISRKVGSARSGRRETTIHSDYIQGDSVGDLEAYYQLHLATMRGHGTPPHSFEFFRTLWDQFSNDERFHLGLQY